MVSIRRATAYTVRKSTEAVLEMFIGRINSLRDVGMNWSPRSLDLTSFDSILWSYPRVEVLKHDPSTMEKEKLCDKKMSKSDLLETVTQNWQICSKECKRK